MDKPQSELRAKPTGTDTDTGTDNEPRPAIVSFDGEAWLDDPAYRSDYLSQTPDARIHQEACPGPSVSRLLCTGRSFIEVTPGGSAILSVQSAADAPINWYAEDCGVFAENGLAALSTVSDAEGKATATWTATPGVTGEATILAVSPLCSGTARFTITVTG